MQGIDTMSSSSTLSLSTRAVVISDIRHLLSISINGKIAIDIDITIFNTYLIRYSNLLVIPIIISIDRASMHDMNTIDSIDSTIISIFQYHDIPYCTVSISYYGCRILLINYYRIL